MNVTQGPTQISAQLESELDRVDPDAFADDLKPGTRLLGGHYVISGFLNSGGFGITYLAKDSLDRTVVIKECFPNALCRRSTSLVRARSRKHQGDFRGFVESFLAEAKSLSRLVHPNIVGVHQVFEDNDTAYMAIDYIDGRDLHDILDSTDQAFTPDQVVAMLKKMLSAVEFIHQVGILHRDISPDNILVDKTGNPILIDFGAASEQVMRATRVLTGRRVIKEGYSPQEFYLTGAEQSPASDLYSLGATFYHVITGSPPPESQRRLARVAEGESDPYQPLAGRFEGYPPGFLEAIDKAVRVMPRDRIQSAGDWLDWIRIGEEGGPLPAALTDAPQVIQSRPLTRPTVGGGGLLADNMGYLVGAGAVFLIAGIAALWSYLG
ncbi:serine/threonine-protein kinase [Tabrizicola sp.]|uniref:serine/threonine-protein kinase n=1 Tax=Tabrizicola sp. TaxID=2005166 RepID=UPI001A414A7B|nr:serine/threonine-protein kinase [Tabrizicola sp.]MBL9064183.1 serine/threonine protein kinase [Tabrizicola sp.]